ncbi:MAG: site-2 protease family protein [Pyrinomonadaceae bacterium]
MENFLSPIFLSNLAIFLVNLLLAISAHEAAHAWTSYKFGDDTAFLLGRVTLNPLKHIDPIGTLVLPILSFVFGAMGGGYARIPLIGWGKPTPVSPRKWNNFKKADFWVSIAGVLANLLLVLISLIIAKIIFMQGYTPENLFANDASPLLAFVSKMMVLNLSLAVFNLVPIPPLDGGKILANFLPQSLQPLLQMIEQFGFVLLLIFVYLGLFNLIMYPFFIALGTILNFIS